MSPAVAIHLAAAACVAILAAVQFLRPQGTASHRTLGRLWVGAMAVVAIGSFAIPTFMAPALGGFPLGPIHLLSILMLWGLYRAVRAARRGEVARHRHLMRGLTIIYVLVGLATLAPGRLLSGLVFGPA